MVKDGPSDTPQNEPLKMTQQEFAAVTGFSRSTIARWIRDGILPVFTINGRNYLRRDMAMAWFDQHTSGGMAPDDN